nr:VWA domain-containing protein [Acidobacteriota bacterium]
PIEKAKEAMKLALDGLNPQDTFNLITFAGDTHILFETPASATRENLAKAQKFLASREGGGGTEMMKAIKAALEPTDSQQHVRVVCFMTDGYIGNDLEIVGEIQKHKNARVFSFGIGQSVNRFLLDKMAEEGRGEAEYVALTDDGSAAAKRFHERVRSPLLTDISLDFGNLQVADVYPKRINDLFSAKPVVVHGRFIKAGNGVIKLKGKSFGRETVREIAVNFPENEPNHDVLATLWARTRIDDLMSQDYAGVQNGNAKPEVKDTITNLGLEYRLLTQFTSFVAVEERIVTDGGQPRKIEVPVEMPEGVSREGIFGAYSRDDARSTIPTVGYSTKAMSAQSLPLNSRNPQGFLNQVTAGRRNARESNAASNSMANVRRLELSKSVENEVISIDGAQSDAPIISQGIKATTLPKPEYPQNANANGAVNVEVTLDANGSVASAKAISGDKAFYLTTETAAKNAKFEIPKLSVEIAKITGVIAYNFAAKDKTVTVAPELQNVRVEVKPNKYHSSVKALIERLKNKQTQPTTDEAKFIRDGKAEIIVRVKELKPETIAELKKLGFEVLTEMISANAVVGRIAIEKIAALAEIDQVTFISPQNR